MKKTIVILFLPLISFSQKVEINTLQGTINTNDAELNFIQKDDSTAHFTMLYTNKTKIKSRTYVTSLYKGKWSIKRETKYNFLDLNTGNLFFLEDTVFLLLVIMKC